MSKMAPNVEKLAQIVRERRLSKSEIDERSQAVHRFVLDHGTQIRQPNFDRIATDELGLMFQIIDEISLDGQLGRTCESTAFRPLRFRLSKRMTSAGGMTTMHAHPNGSLEFEIAIATTPLFQTFIEGERSKVGGRSCNDRLEALQRIMEHEMIHLAEMLIWRDSNCHASRFKGISNRLFAHTESNHQLMTPSDVARKKMNIRPGDYVAFQDGRRMLQGYVNRITKRATILVQDPKGRLYSDGHRYSKYYVPLERLRKTAA